jgi:GT2 family glycosyltransferase
MVNSSSLDAVAIAIPVNDEADLLPACIAGLRATIEHCRRRYPRIAVAVSFALDRCTDDSAEIIHSAGFETASPPDPGVGAARAAAVDAAMRSLPGSADHRMLIVCTDADSVVPAGWLVHLIELADLGADVIVGPVRPSERDLDRKRLKAWELTHLDGEANGHVHGANLGVRANFYRAVGGFAPVHEHEDVDLVRNVVALGARLLVSDQSVTTSGRLRGRTAGGYAGYLRDQLIPLARTRHIPESVS